MNKIARIIELYMSKKAAGLINLKGLEKKIARVITNRMGLFIEGSESVEEAMSRLKGRTMHQYRVVNYIDSDILKTESANKLFNDTLIEIRLFKDGRRQGNMKAQGSTNRFHLSIDLYLPMILENALEMSPLQLISKDMLYKAVMPVLGHELLHAADWAYNNAHKPRDAVKEDVSEFEYIKYLNSDTELKSWAYSIGVEAIQIMDNRGLTYNDGLALSANDVLELIMDTPHGQDMMPFIQEKNKKKFIQRVTSYIRKHYLELRNEDLAEAEEYREPGDYRFRKYIDYT